jgi:hypothetical protein
VGASDGPVPAIAPPFSSLPHLEGPQVKVEIGSEAPTAPAMTFVGGQNAWLNFTIWYWDTGPATAANVFVDGSQYAMTELAGQDGDYGNGTIYRAEVNATELGGGVHTWYYDFNGPGGQKRFPASGTMGALVVDRA